MEQVSVASLSPPASLPPPASRPSTSSGRPERVEGRLSPIPRIIVWAIGWRLLTALLAFLANIVFPLKQEEQFTVFDRTNLFWDTFARYDSGWFYGIAHSGYRYTPGGRDNLAFFPVYPLLMRYLGDLFGGTPPAYYIAAIAISWTAFVLAMVMLYRVASLDLDPDEAERAVWYATVFPFAFFYGVVYSESVFLLFLLVSVFGFRTRRWWLGGIAGALACCTRVNGIFALPALMFLALQAARVGKRGSAFATASPSAEASADETADKSRVAPWEPRDLMKALGGVALAASGVLVYSAYVYSVSGSWFHWADTITEWSYHPGGNPAKPIATLLWFLFTQPYAYLTQNPLAPYDLLNGSAAIALLIAVPFVWRRFGVGYALLMIVNLWVPLSSGWFEGVGRYCAVLFPAFVWLGTFRSPTVHAWMLATFGMVYLLSLALFTKLHPIF